ncbi:MAG: topoisomerase [Crocinitomicaceae bacterium]|jgi:DNA topoisomerase-1|nr:topoisomerase [Crocinitomicaceae bacterium]
MSDTDLVLEETGLIYLSDSVPGISRQWKRNKFVFLDSRGQEIRDEKTLLRIRKLVIPPAWTNVWIAPKKNAHLQATGIDQAGRKQYRYHEDWCRTRNETKYFRLLEFGGKLPEFRRNIAKDLRRKNLDERKVLAISVNMMQKTLIRVGNESYKQLYGSYGLTTLRDKHVRISGSKLKLSFRGKKGVEQDITLTDRNLARLVKKCREIPGQELFQFYLPDGGRKSIDSGLINRYIREVTCCDFTAKDFRTWSGTLEMLRELALRDYPKTEGGRKRILNEALDAVAAKLGNTRAVCKKSYVFPALVDAYENGLLLPYLKKIKKEGSIVADKGLSPDEKVLLNFLKSERKRKTSH